MEKTFPVLLVHPPDLFFRHNLVSISYQNATMITTFVEFLLDIGTVTLEPCNKYYWFNTVQYNWLLYIHTYINTYIHTYIHTYVRTYVRTYVLTYQKGKRQNLLASHSAFPSGSSVKNREGKAKDSKNKESERYWYFIICINIRSHSSAPPSKKKIIGGCTFS